MNGKKYEGNEMKIDMDAICKTKCICNECLKGDVCAKRKELEDAYNDTIKAYEDFDYFIFTVYCKFFVDCKNNIYR